MQPTDLNALIQKTLELFAKTRKEICLHENLSKALWSAEVDRRQIEQVLMHIFVNAWRAMPNGGDLYVETANVNLESEIARPYGLEPGRFVRIRIRDTGMGIDDKVNRGIFEPLFTLREVGGKENGLGTNSVHGIIQRHQGLISVESENGRGATCILCLPALSDESAAFPAEPALQGILIDGQETLLLVDDDVPVLRTTKEHLKELGYTLHTAKNGPEALGIYQDRWKEIDLVILDPVMPGMDGATVFDALKEINPKVKCLLSTGHSLDGLAGDAMKRGFAGYIQKPFDLFEISQRIRDVLETDDFPASSPATG